MITIQGTELNLAAYSKSSDKLASQKGRFVSAGDIVKLYSVSSAAGVNITFGTANDIFIDDKEHTAIGTTLNKKDHEVGEFRVTADGELSLTYRETANVATSDMIFCVEVYQEDIDF